MNVKMNVKRKKENIDRNKKKSNKSSVWTGQIKDLIINGFVL